MENKYFIVSSSEASLGTNSGCEKAPEFLSKIFGVESKEFYLTKNDVEKQQEEIYEQALEKFKERGIKIFFGGTHDITFSLFKAFKQINPSAKLLIYDAHADCDEGLSTVSHEDFIKGLVEQKIVKKEDLLLVGVREVFPSEKEFFNSLEKITFEDIKKDFLGTKEKLKKFVLGRELYVSFDVDVLNNKIMQATHYHPKDGLSEDQMEELLEIVMPKAKAIDLVEFNPDKVSLEEDKLLLRLFNKYFK